MIGKKAASISLQIKHNLKYVGHLKEKQSKSKDIYDNVHFVFKSQTVYHLIASDCSVYHWMVSFDMIIVDFDGAKIMCQFFARLLSLQF